MNRTAALAAPEAPRPPADILIVGAQKAGTTSLWAVLARQPWFVRGFAKELHHFDSNRPVPDAVYRSWFADSTRPDARRGEASPDYLASIRAPHRIHLHNPDVRLIALLRDPVDRAVSAFLHAQRLGHVGARATFEQVFFDEAHRRVTERAWTRIRWDGMYARHLSRYLDEFPPEQLHVEYFEDLVARPAEVLGRVWSFLGVEGPFPTELPHRNPSRASRMPRLNGGLALMERRLRRRGGSRIAASVRVLRTRLARPAGNVRLSDPVADRILSHYTDEVARLPSIVGRTPPWPRFAAALGIDLAVGSTSGPVAAAEVGGR